MDPPRERLPRCAPPLVQEKGGDFPGRGSRERSRRRHQPPFIAPGALILSLSLAVMTSGKKTSRSGLGSKQKRGSSGTATQYLTRNAALKRLQVSLPEFRRLCILKGIHPREPRNKAALKGSSKTYYLVKDIAFLLVEPLLETFRARRAYDKKVKKARAKRAFELAQRLQRRKPGYALDHLVRERYPTFDDALRDLDDPLSMLALFATLPAEKRLGIDPKVCAKARRLDVEFGAYVARTNSLRKVRNKLLPIFLSLFIKIPPVGWRRVCYMADRLVRSSFAACSKASS